MASSSKQLTTETQIMRNHIRPEHRFHDDVIKWKHFCVTDRCAGNSPVTGEFPTRRPVTRSFYVFFDLRPNIRLSKQSGGWWFETPSVSLWRHCNAKFTNCFTKLQSARPCSEQNFKTISQQSNTLRANETFCKIWVKDIFQFYIKKAPILLTNICDNRLQLVKFESGRKWNLSYDKWTLSL